MTATYEARWSRASTALAMMLAIAAALAIWMRPRKAGHEPSAMDHPSNPAQLADPAAVPASKPSSDVLTLPSAAVDGARARGLEHFENGEYARAAELLAAVYRARPEDDAVALAVAESSVQIRDLRTAELVIAALREPNAPEALRVRGTLLEQAGKFSEALTLYERASEGLSKPQLTIEARARMLSWLERFDEAAATYATLLADDSADLEQRRRVRVRLAELTAWRKDLEGALAQLAEVLVEEPGRADALLLQGQILEWQGRYPEAKRSYSTLLAADSDHAEARLRLNKLLWVR